MSLTNEQIKQIIDNAPSETNQYEQCGKYWYVNTASNVYIESPMHNLSDLAEILALRERVAELEQGGWIRVDERLPDTDGVYLTYNPRSYFYLPEQVMRFIKGGWEFSNALITHWSNLPQLPKEQDND